MKVHCRTNLDDVMYHETWPTELPERPVVGDYIESSTFHGLFRLWLEVCTTTWKNSEHSRIPTGKANEWYLEVELHIPRLGGQPRSIAAWQEWYKNARGGK